MRRSTYTKLAGLLSAFFYTFAVLATNNQPNLYSDKIHLTGENTNTVLTLDGSKQLKSSTITPTQLLDLGTSTNANTPSTLVKRDGSGNFSAGTITGTLVGGATFAQSQWNFTSQTSNYSATLGDWVYANGSSFVITLPDASAPNASGRPIYVQHGGVSLTNVYQINTTAGQTITAAPDNTVYTTGQISLYTNNEQFEFRANNGNWTVTIHRSDTDFKDLGTFIQYYTYTVSSAAATGAAVYSPAITFTLTAAGNATAAATYVPSWVYSVSPAAATVAATYNPAYVFTPTLPANATVAAVYKDGNGASYTVAATIAASSPLVVTGTATPPASGTLVLFSGVGDANINYTSVAGNPTTQGTYTVANTIAAGTTLVTTSTATAPNASGRLVKLAGTGDAVIQYTSIAGAPSTTTTCTTAATIAAQTSVVKTCTADPPAAGTLTKTVGTGDVILPYNSWVGENTAAGVKVYRVSQTIAAQTTLITQSEAVIPTLSSGKLGKISGTGDTVITYSAVTGAPNTLLATTTPPTFYGSPLVNNWKWRRLNGKYVEVWYNYYQSIIGFGAGSGTWLWPMPPNIPIDTVKAPATQNLGAGAQSGTEQAEQPSLTQFRWPMTGSADQNAAAYMPYAFAVPWSSTQFRAFCIHYNLSSVFVSQGSTFIPPTIVFGTNIRVIFPVQNWIP